jgi:hypothetical protein
VALGRSLKELGSLPLPLRVAWVTCVGTVLVTVTNASGAVALFLSGPAQWRFRRGDSMAPGVLFGLLMVVAGLFSWAIARPLARRAAKIRTWVSATADLAWWTQRSTTQVRVLAVCWVVLGFIIAILSLTAGL